MSQSLRVSRIHFAAAVDIAVWRALAFARSLQGRSPWAGRQLRRVVLLLWWTATLQLHTHTRYWLRARRLRRAAPVALPAPTAETVDLRKLAVPLSDDPLVSVIVPTYGQVPFTLRCLASIADHAPTLPIEVIVVDDGWSGSDGSSSCGSEGAGLDHVRGIRLIRNERKPRLPATAATRRLRRRKARYLYVPQQRYPGAGKLAGADAGAVRRKAALTPGRSVPSCSIPNGSLQEAGGIIWQRRFRRGISVVTGGSQRNRSTTTCGKSTTVPVQRLMLRA